MTPTEYLDLPDFLDSVANAEAANGSDVNAAEFRRRAEQARDLQRAAELVTRERDDIAARLAKANDRVARIECMALALQITSKAAA